MRTIRIRYLLPIVVNSKPHSLIHYSHLAEDKRRYEDFALPRRIVVTGASWAKSICRTNAANISMSIEVTITRGPRNDSLEMLALVFPIRLDTHTHDESFNCRNRVVQSRVSADDLGSITTRLVAIKRFLRIRISTRELSWNSRDFFYIRTLKEKQREREEKKIQS